jgi:hypothetical protein
MHSLQERETVVRADELKEGDSFVLDPDVLQSLAKIAGQHRPDLLPYLIPGVNRIMEQTPPFRADKISTDSSGRIHVAYAKQGGGNDFFILDPDGRAWLPSTGGSAACAAYSSCPSTIRRWTPEGTKSATPTHISPTIQEGEYCSCSGPKTTNWAGGESFIFCKGCQKERQQ